MMIIQAVIMRSTFALAAMHTMMVWRNGWEDGESKMNGWQENPETKNYVEQHAELLAALKDVEGVVYVSDEEISPLMAGGDVDDFIAGLYEAWEEAAAVGF
jgi:alpha-amylase/alpha-mannosidase (GH57 family)